MAHPFDFDWALPTAPEDVPLPPGLEEQLADIHSLHPRARALAGLLVRCGQTHLFSEWVPGEDAEEKRRFFAQVEGLHEAYPGGLDGYAGRARRLLARSRVGVALAVPRVRARHDARHGLSSSMLYGARALHYIVDTVL